MRASAANAARDPEQPAIIGLQDRANRRLITSQRTPDDLAVVGAGRYRFC